MSIFQCDNCGCAENTALGWYHSRNNKRLTREEYRGKALCSACAPLNFPDGTRIEDFNGEWHNEFERVYLPLGMFITNDKGNIEHVETGAEGNKAYDKYGMSSREELRDLPEEGLLERYDIACKRKNKFLMGLCEEAMQEYHFCDVCGSHSSIDDPCKTH